jgi:hypothetical protein
MIAKPEGCVDYSVEISGSLQEGSPPWDAHVVRYPPGEDTPGFEGRQNVPKCWTDPNGLGLGSPPKTVDLEKAIGEYCGNGAKFEDELNRDRKTISWFIWNGAKITVGIKGLIYSRTNERPPPNWWPVNDMQWCE